MKIHCSQYGIVIIIIWYSINMRVLANSYLNIIEILLIGGRVRGWVEDRGQNNEWYTRRNILNIILLLLLRISLATTILYYYATPPPSAKWRCTTGSDHDFIQISPSAALWNARSRIMFACKNPLSLSHTICSCLYNSNNVNKIQRTGRCGII